VTRRCDTNKGGDGRARREVAELAGGNSWARRRRLLWWQIVMKEGGSAATVGSAGLALHVRGDTYHLPDLNRPISIQ
jgi:hypothetical protein